MKRILLLVIWSFFILSCEKQLQESPQSVVEENFYQTAEEIRTAVNAIYTPLRVTMIPNYIATLECQSDWMYGRGSWMPLSEYQGLNDANISRVSGFWNSFYLSVRNANLVIKNAPLGESIEPLDAARFIAEAKFMRAYNYFQLVRNWGAIPLRTEVNMLERDIPKSTVSAVYELILSDLLDAETNLPMQQSDLGRPTSWSAKTLLTEVYLQLEQFENAALKAQEIIQSNSFSLVQVNNKLDFQYNLFGPAIQTTTEEIFSLKYSRLPNQGNYILWISNHPSTQLFSFDGAYAVHGDASNPNYQNWDDGDIRKELWDQIDFGLGPNTLVSSKYIDPEAISQVGAGNDLPIYRYADVLLFFAEADCRVNGSITPAAMEALNEVRRRAYGFDPKSSSEKDYAISDYTVDSFMDLLIQERGYEFMYEGKRWLDIKRMGKVDELIQYGKGRTLADMHLLWPIPLSELNYNDAMDASVDQNPGY